MRSQHVILPGVNPQDQNSSLASADDPITSADPEGDIPTALADEGTESSTDVGDLPALTVISQAALMLMSASAAKLGLADDEATGYQHQDLDEAQRLITALAGLVTASAPYLGMHATQIRDALREPQLGFRAASNPPDAAGDGPGEKLTGPVFPNSSS